MSAFSKNVEFLSAKSGLSIRQIALKSGISPSTLTRILKNGALPRTDTLSDIAAALHVDPWTLQTKDMEAEGTDPVVARWNEEDVRIRDTDLNNYARLRELSRKASDVEWPGPHVAGSLLLTMPTDELSPVTPRGATLYITVESDQFHPDAANGEEAVGIIDSEEDGLGQYTFGRLTMAQGRMFITPTNPTMATPVEVKRVTARVAGWVVIRQKQP